MTTSLPQNQGTGTLSAHSLSLGYGDKTVVDSLSLDITPGSFTVLIGPNGCGKSTLLNGLARVLTPQSGHISLRGKPLGEWHTKHIAQQLAVLPQSPIVPEGITIRDLVKRGRHPHRSTFSRWSAEDEAQVQAALVATDLVDLAHRPAAAISGGQRQRAFIAMVLAQNTPLMLLDEPTTFLDIAHQFELLELCARLNRQMGRTLIVVLHDLNQAARYATDLVAMDAGRIVAHGAPRDVLTAQTVKETFGINSVIVDDPVTGTPMVVPDIARTA